MAIPNRIPQVVSFLLLVAIVLVARWGQTGVIPGSWWAEAPSGHRTAYLEFQIDVDEGPDLDPDDVILLRQRIVRQYPPRLLDRGGGGEWRVSLESSDTSEDCLEAASRVRPANMEFGLTSPLRVESFVASEPVPRNEMRIGTFNWILAVPLSHHGQPIPITAIKLYDQPIADGPPLIHVETTRDKRCRVIGMKETVLTDPGIFEQLLDFFSSLLSGELLSL